MTPLPNAGLSLHLRAWECYVKAMCQGQAATHVKAAVHVRRQGRLYTGRGLQVETHAQQHRYLEEHASQVVLRAQHPELGPRPNPALACGLLRAALWFGCLCAVCRDRRTISGWTLPDWLPAAETVQDTVSPAWGPSPRRKSSDLGSMLPKDPRSRSGPQGSQTQREPTCWSEANADQRPAESLCGGPSQVTSASVHCTVWLRRSRLPPQAGSLCGPRPSPVPRRGGREAVSREWKVWPPEAPRSCWTSTRWAM